MEYFYEKNLAALKGWLVLLDYEGTLVAPGNNTLNEETRKALDALRKENNVVICSNGPVVEGFEQEYGVTWAHLSEPKPNPTSLEPLIRGRTSRIVVIGDTWRTDGVLANRLGAPFVQVATLGRPKKPAILNEDKLPAVLLPHTHETVALITHGPLSFVRDIAHNITHRTMLKEIEHLAHALEQIGVRVAIDPPHLQGFHTAVVCAQDSESFEYALQAKQHGFVVSLLVFVNTTPKTPKERALLQHHEIDAVLVKSEMLKKQLVAVDQYFSRSTAWRAGLPTRDSRRLPPSTTQECELVALQTVEKEFKHIVDILWRFGVSLSVPSQHPLQGWRRLLRPHHKASWQLIVSDGSYEETAEQAWMSDLPTLIIAPEEEGVALPEHCGLRIDTVEQLEAVLPDFLESLPSYQPLQYAHIHCSVDSRARQLMSLIRGLSTS